MRLSEEQLYKVFNSSPTALSVVSLTDRCYIYANESFLAITGYSREELLGKSTSSLIICPGFDNSPGRSAEGHFITRSGQRRVCTIFTETAQVNGENCLVLALKDLTELRRAEERLRFKNSILAQINDAVVTTGSDGTITYWNGGAERLYGLMQDEAVGRRLEDVLQYRWLSQGDEELAEKSMAESGSWRGINIHVLKTGQEIYAELSVSTVKDSVGSVIGRLAIIRDITGRVKMESELRNSEERFRTSVETMLDCFGIYSAVRGQSGRIEDFLVEYVNQAACANNHMTKEEQVGRRLLDILPAHFESGLFYDYCRVVETGRPLIKETLEYEEVYGDRRLSKAFDIRAVRLGDGFAAAWKDVTDRKRAEEEMRELLLVDELTGLYNRRGFLTLAQHQLKIARRMKRDMLLLFADVDGLKNINDTLGHYEGDRALTDVAAILKQTFRDPDILARIGGDEYSVLAIEASTIDMEIIYARFAENLDSFNKKMNRPYKLSVSIGIAHYDPSSPCFINELMERADRLMYEQKRRHAKERR